MNVDLIGQGQALGEVAGALMSNGQLNVPAMRPYIDPKTGKGTIAVFKGGDASKPENYTTRLVNNATLRREEWKRLDEAIIPIKESRLGGVADLVNGGLTFDVGNGMGSTVLEWHDVGDALEAELTMDAITRGKNDRPVFQHNYLPLPILHVDYEINARALAMSRNLGNPLDVTMVERASRKINLKLEQMLFTNTDYAFGETDSRSRNKIYSYINFPDRNQATLSVNWDASAKSAADIVAEVLSLKQTMINNYYMGPFKLYIPTAYETVIDADYDTTAPTGTTIRERLLKIDGISGISVVDTLPANNVLMVQMTTDVVRLVRGMGTQNIQWGVEGNMITKYKVMTIQVPQIRSDQNGKCGIVHLA